MISLSTINIVKKALTVLCFCILAYICFNYSRTLVGVLAILSGTISTCDIYTNHSFSNKLDSKSFFFAITSIFSGLILIFIC
ncbi:hypothetical protein GCM10008904_04470 [Paraclostridium ghonii]|uniref:Secreted protein n=1 Tax=Paraclostridium ghonii TaxID=29358 RepID=A0ABU0N3S0_9FIRM|nr:hypothetical protein [Paeniclostridium ghonii]MDQ0557346.1 putative secreted protein [Paeniclostridium ghonii]